MTVRPIQYEISVDGGSEATGIFAQIGVSSRDAARSFSELHVAASQVFGVLNQMGSAGQAVGGVFRTITQAGMQLAQGGLTPVNIAMTALTSAIELGSTAWQAYQDHVHEAERAAQALRQTFAQTAHGQLDFAVAQQEVEVNRLRTQGSNAEFAAAERTLAYLRQRASEEQNITDQIAAQDHERDVAAQNEERYRAQNQAAQHEVQLAMQDIERGEQQRAQATAAAQRARAEQLQHEREFAVVLEHAQQVSAATEEQGIAVRQRLLEIDNQIADQEKHTGVEEERAAADRHRHEMERLNQYHDELKRIHDERVQSAQQFAGPITSMFVGALSKTIAGTQSAGDAFKGLLSSFLELISQQAALKAAFEFAEAAASLASFNYGGAALHAAAGVGFAAVAVAAGVGSALTAPPSTPAPNSGANAAPASPGGGGNVVIQWNSPIITVGSRAEVGRSISQLSRASNTQYGATV